jgi:hypothetical protein
LIVDLSGFSTGVCDRLRQVTFCAVLADYLGDELLEIYETKSNEGPFFVADLFDIVGLTCRKLDVTPCDSWRMTPHNSIISLATVKAFKPNFVNVSDEVFLNDWIRIYRRLRPRTGVIDITRLEQLESIKKGAVGIHIRLTDRVTRWPSRGAITLSQYNEFKVKKVPWIIRFSKLHNYDVFLASDNLNEDIEIRSLLRGAIKIIEYEKNWKSVGIRNTDGESFLIDLFGLAYSKVIFSTTGGGVTLTASLIGGLDPNAIHVWTSERVFDMVLIRLREFLGKNRISIIIRSSCKRLLNIR